MIGMGWIMHPWIDRPERARNAERMLDAYKKLYEIYHQTEKTNSDKKIYKEFEKGLRNHISFLDFLNSNHPLFMQTWAVAWGAFLLWDTFVYMTYTLALPAMASAIGCSTLLAGIGLLACYLISAALDISLAGAVAGVMVLLTTLVQFGVHKIRQYKDEGIFHDVVIEMVDEASSRVATLEAWTRLIIITQTIHWR